MNQTKYQVFISSTYTDLIKARDQITQSILSFYHFPVGMEMFSAGDSDQWTVIQSTIDSSDYYVLILGHRYGSVTEEGISYTEKEYDYAKEKGIPILAFIMDRDAPTTRSEREQDPELQEKLDRFVEKAKGNKMCDFWKTPDELASKVIIALSKAFVSHPRIGWVRADQATSPKVTEELAGLSKENRELKAELEALKKITETKRPLLSVNLNGGSLEVEYEENPQFSFLEGPKLFSMEDIPTYLRNQIKEEDITDYNDSLPTEIAKVKEFNEELALFQNVKLFGVESEISISNTGQLKATNIYVDLKFPESVTVIEGSKESFTLPSRPILSLTPIRQAEKKYNDSLGIDRSVLDKLAPSFNMFGKDMFGKGLANYTRTNSPTLIKPGSMSWLENNTITFKCNELLHTRVKSCLEDYILIAKKPGNYEVEVSLICEEYSEPETIIIPLVINHTQKQEIQ
ncbi:DUF4062 domain-containing protein [Priestia megaterium]|uniref:DUF4062 domain-containing protein n=1 Tax=Priestia megaterium TaxID=1404 RepID=UPI001A949EA1|nr:DUF4062 domain-containing protein [Priestia megaterium]QSX23906.1 DUF4062 domain-containing protein [Priestia megaterium]